jgi:NADH:ubiquinone oxidoreductase subunit 3 (subunit A)
MTSQLAEMWLPLALFCLFALFSVAGAYLAAAHVRGRKVGVLAALATAVFFCALLVGLGALLREGGAL